MRTPRFLLPFFTLGVALFFTACSTDEGGTRCAASSDCERGLSCQPDGSCGEFSCNSSSDCLNTGEFTETCLFDNGSGAYSPSSAGVCSDQECRSDRDCASGETCIDRACYAGTDGPIDCTCREDCPSGQACVAGECSAPLSSGACSGDCECAMGDVCDGGRCTEATDECGGTCGADEVCEGGACVPVGAGCNPACGEGETCNEGVCEPTVVEGGLCSACTSDADCGGEGDTCVVLAGGATGCGRACGDSAPCPDGYRCLAGDTRTPSQCVPAGGVCSGCLVSGCGATEFCNPATTACEPLVDTCNACAGDAMCGDGSICTTYGGSDICLQACSGPGECGEGFECTTLGSEMACAPTAGGCGGAGCDLLPADCAAPLGVLDSARCICVGCLTPGDCAEGQTCSTAGTCVADGRPCSTTAECDGGYCQGGICIDCLTPGDCADGEVCIAGACQDCGCAANERCTASGTCEEIPDPSSCTTDSECVNIARTLGYTGDNAACDSTIGCYTIGTCNGDLADLGGEFGGAVDPFDAPCPAGTACTGQLDIFGMFGGGSFFVFQCTGCSEADPSTCREGEVCSVPLFDITGSAQPTCGTGGSDFPFPFP